MSLNEQKDKAINFYFNSLPNLDAFRVYKKQSDVTKLLK